MGKFYSTHSTTRRLHPVGLIGSGFCPFRNRPAPGTVDRQDGANSASSLWRFSFRWRRPRQIGPFV